jgi:site-specific DNA recombinase
MEGEMDVNVAVYCRVSTEKQGEDGTSLDTQEAGCRAYCTEQGWQVAAVYREQYSGFTRERPQLVALREAVRDREYDAVVVYAVDRLSRNQTDLAIILDEMENHRVTIACVTEPLESTAIGKFMLNARAFVAEVEREKIKERTLRGKRARAQEGKIHRHGQELYGYRRNKEAGVRLVYEPEATVVRQIFEWVGIERVSLRTVVSRLNEQGIASPSMGKLHYDDPERITRWGKSQVVRMLRNPAYKGESIAWRWQSNKHRNSSLRPAEEWIRLPDGTTPALVSQGLWDAAQTVLDNNKAADATRNESRAYLLRGHVYCAVCGRRMWAEPEHGKRIYRCSSRYSLSGSCGASRVPADEVEADVWAQITAFLGDEAVIAAEVQRQHEQGPDAALVADYEAARRALSKIELQQERLIRRFTESGDETFPWELVQREIARLEADKKSLMATIADLKRDIDEQAAAVVRLDALATYCQRVHAKLQCADFEHKRWALDALSVRVIASGREWRAKGSVNFQGAGGTSHLS